ncbi:MAG: iron-sulfur cluster assembly scaffold protein [Alphaproteobacteria bacterium]|jgi:nitrogen fixation NifU-like protein|nr:iron-sulfur cluster assembly scaffold protein [Alphaproteobacteria bacterium]
MIDDIYQQAILELARAAGETRRLERPAITATAENPLCGDRITVDLKVVDGRIAAHGHGLRGCMLCEAAAALVAREIAGRPVAELTETTAAFVRMIRADGPVPERWPDLAAFTPVKAVPGRHECVLLPFTAVETALSDAGLITQQARQGTV